MSFMVTMMESLCVIKRPTIGRDSAQGVTQDPFVTIGSTLPCCLQQNGPSVTSMYSQRNVTVSSTVYFGQDPSIQVNDIMVVTDRLGVSRTFLALGESQPLGRGHTWYVHCTYTGAPS